MKIIKKLSLLVLLMLLHSSSYASENYLRIHGSTSVRAVVSIYQEEIERKIGMKLILVGNSSKEGIEDLLEGYADIAMISTPLQYLKSTFQNTSLDSLITFPVGESKIVFINNKANPIRSIPMKKIKLILDGEITNWKELGGDDAQILIVTEYPGSGIRTHVEKVVLHKKITQPAKLMINSKQVADIVGEVSNAFGISTTSLLTTKIREIKTEETIIQPLIFVSKPANARKIDLFISAIKNLKIKSEYLENVFKNQLNTPQIDISK